MEGKPEVIGKTFFFFHNQFFRSLILNSPIDLLSRINEVSTLILVMEENHRVTEAANNLPDLNLMDSLR